MMLRKSIERLRNCEVAVKSPILAEKLTCYAGILAAEGSLTTAMTYLPENSDQVRSGSIPTPEASLANRSCRIHGVFFLFVSAWDQNAERQTVSCSDRSREQSGRVGPEDRSCCSDSCTKGSNSGII